MLNGVAGLEIPEEWERDWTAVLFEAALWSSIRLIAYDDWMVARKEAAGARGKRGWAVACNGATGAASKRGWMVLCKGATGAGGKMGSVQ